VRIAYSTDGVVRRGPVPLRARDLGRLRDARQQAPALAARQVGGTDGLRILRGLDAWLTMQPAAAERRPAERRL
jgi:hypothetical protein